MAIARSYARGGAAAISVLTEPTFFDGSLADLSAVREAVETPILRKDFIVTEYQLFEARAAGADAVLLIVAALPARALHALAGRAVSLGLDVLVEVHDAQELTVAIDAGAMIVGVNNRNLRTLAVDVRASDDLMARIPAGVVAVSESGLKTTAELQHLRAAGYSAFLVGERLMLADDPEAAVRQLLVGGADAESALSIVMFVKICGITRREDAEAAVAEGATAIGFVFWPGSPRFIAPSLAREIVATLPPSVAAVGVFVNQPASHVNSVASLAGVSAVQLHGDEDEGAVAEMTLPVIKAVSVRDGAFPDRRWPERVMLLIDADDPIRRVGRA